MVIYIRVIHIHIPIYMSIHMYIHVCMYIYVCVRACVHICVSAKFHSERKDMCVCNLYTYIVLVCTYMGITFSGAN